MKKIDWNRNVLQGLSEADYLMGRLGGTMDRMPEPEIRHLLLIREVSALCRKDWVAVLKSHAESARYGSSVESAMNAFHQAAGESPGSSSVSVRRFVDLHVMLHQDQGSERRASSRFESAAEHLRGIDPFLIRAGLMLCESTLLENELPGAQGTGQLVFTALTVSGAMVPWPGLGISPFLNATSADHLKLCRAVQKTGDPEPWLLYFLDGVARQCEDLIGRMARIEETVQTWKRTLSAPRHAAALLLTEKLAGNPFLTVRGAAAQLDAAFTTAQRAVDKLLEAGILQETTNQRRDRIFCANDIFAVLNEPPRVISAAPWREKEIIPELKLLEEPPAPPPRHDPAAKLPIPY